MRSEQDALLGDDVEQPSGSVVTVAATTGSRVRSTVGKGLLVVAVSLVGVAIWRRRALPSQMSMESNTNLMQKTAMAVHPMPALAEQPAARLVAPLPPAADGAGSGQAPPAEDLPPAEILPGAVPQAAGAPAGALPADAPPAVPVVEDKFAKCPVSGADCRTDRCCKDPGHQCFEKNKDWAECRPECEKGMHITDPDSAKWTCDPFGDKTPGEPKQCSKDGEDCSKSKCCHDAGMQCYEKNEYWSACKPSCTPGPDLLADEPDSWSCTEIGPRSPGAGAWVQEECAQEGEDCRDAGCCAAEGQQCFLKSEGWGQCRKDCTPGMKDEEWDEDGWDCTAVGPVTPASGAPSEQVKGQVAAWVAEECKSEGENCLEAQCCKSVGWQCYKKNEFWAQCLPDTCPPPVPTEPPPPAAPGRRLQAPPAEAAPADPPPAAPAAPAAPEPEAWDCTAMGPRSFGLSVKGYPSLYCISLYMPSSYEGAIINKQLEMGAGIFSCDGYDVIASDEVTCGTSKDGVLVKTLTIPKIEVGVSQDGTAGNAKLFMAFWDKIIAGKRFRDYDWTIKADPDAVVLAWRLREKMAPHLGENVYVVNCNKFPSSPNFPMMFGSVEILSSGAMIAYADGSWKCGQELPWDAWGEDYYLTHCLDFLGVGRIDDFTVVGDDVCTGADCGDGQMGSYHPFKTPEDWAACWTSAVPPA